MSTKRLMMLVCKPVFMGDADGDYLSDAKGKVIGDIYENPELLRNDNASIQTMQIL
jgi:hypothetical protein